MHKREWARKVTFCSLLSHWGFVRKLPCTEAHLEPNEGQALIKKPMWTLAGVQQHLTSQWAFITNPITYVDGLVAIRPQTSFAPTTETYMTGINVVGTGHDLESTSKSSVQVSMLEFVISLHNSQHFVLSKLMEPNSEETF